MKVRSAAVVIGALRGKSYFSYESLILQHRHHLMHQDL